MYPPPLITSEPSTARLPANVDVAVVEVAFKYGIVIAPESVCAPATVKLPDTVRLPVIVPPFSDRYDPDKSGIALVLKPVMVGFEMVTLERLLILLVAAMAFQMPPLARVEVVDVEP